MKIIKTLFVAMAAMLHDMLFMWMYRSGYIMTVNVLTSLSADIYKAADTVGRELVGVIPSVTINAGAEAVAIGDVIRSAFTRTAAVGTITPSMVIPEGNDQTVDNKTMTLDQTASVKIPWTGEDIKHVDNGAGYTSIYGDQIAQAMRAITNQIEAYAWRLAYKGASRAFGTAGTTPFAANFNEIAELRQILIDNGCPDDGQLTLVMNTIAGTKLRNLAQLQQVNTSGDSSLLRQGELLNLQRIMLKESAAPIAVTKGTGASYTSSAAGYAVGATDIAVITGTGTILAGDVVTFTGDNNKYVVAVGVTAAGTISLNAPGLRLPLAASAVALTVGATSTSNIVLHKGCFELAVRPIALPMGGDDADDQMTVQDPHSGLSFDVSAYKGYKKAMFDISCVYGGKMWKPDHAAILLG